MAELPLILDKLGSKVTMAGFGRLEVSNAGIVASYDRKAAEAVILLENPSI